MGADIDFSLALRGSHLHLNVRDISTDVPPQPPDPATIPAGALGGRGLNLVDRYATAWGARTSATGKVMWATFRATPARTDPGS